MDTSPADDLAAVVNRFIEAEDALAALRERSDQLAEAAALVQTTGKDLEGRTRTSLEALEETRAALRTRAEADIAHADLRREVEERLGELCERFHVVLTQLLTIDPARFATQLEELRRDSADNAAEVREVRRLLTEVQREQTQLRQAGESADRRLSSVEAALSRSEAGISRLEESTTELAKAQQESAASLASEQQRLRTLMNALLVVAVLGMIAAMIGLFV